MTADEQLELLWKGAAQEAWEKKVDGRMRRMVHAQYQQLGAPAIDVILDGMRQAFVAGFIFGGGFERKRGVVPDSYRHDGGAK